VLFHLSSRLLNYTLTVVTHQAPRLPLPLAPALSVNQRSSTEKTTNFITNH